MLLITIILISFIKTICYSFCSQMARRTFIELFVLFLGFSYLLSSSAVPTTRSLKSTKEDPSTQELLVQGEAEKMVEIFEGVMDESESESESERRIDIERLDYAESSASHQHDPKIPGGRP